MNSFSQLLALDFMDSHAYALAAHLLREKWC